MNDSATKPLSSASDPPHIAEPAAWLAILATSAAILLLAALHVLSPEFSPSWRVISEYAFGHYGWVLSLMFLSSGIGSRHLVAGPHQSWKGRFVVPDYLRYRLGDGLRF